MRRLAAVSLSRGGSLELSIAPDVFAAFPGLRVAAVAAQGVENDRPRPGLDAAWEEAWAAAAGTAPVPVSAHPRVRAWRDAMRAVGVSPRDFPSSVEALLRRAARGGPALRINPLVDFYNSVCLRRVVPAGGFDCAVLRGPIELRLTREGDTFEALDATDPVPVPPGEVAYADGPVVLTRHFVWRQSRAGLIGPCTRDVLLVSEVLGSLPPGDEVLVRDDLAGGLRENFGVEPLAFVLDAAHPAVSW